MTIAKKENQPHAKAAWIGFFLGLALLLMTMLLPAPAGMSEAAWLAAGLTMLLAAWWATEALPIPVTSLLPILLIPMLGIGSIQSATAPYSNPVVYLFMGGFIIGLAMQRWDLHRRVALVILRAVGNSPRRQIGGFMLATLVLGMWVSNTATAIMMLPIGLSVIDLVADNEATHHERARFATALMLAIAYTASIGGVTTLIGSPPNAFLAAYLNTNFGIEIGFVEWMLLGVPVAFTMTLLTWLWLTRGGFNLGNMDSHALIVKDLQEMGPMSRGEKLVFLVFLCTAAAWVLRPLIGSAVPGMSDAGIAVAAAIAMFAIPVDAKNRVFLMDWETANKLPWSVLLLFGGGLSLSQVINDSGLAAWLAGNMSVLGTLPVLLVIAGIVALILFVTEIMSNTATAATFLPLIGAMALAHNLPIELLTIPATMAASFAFMMPVATPPNAIAFGSGYVSISAMMRNGMVLNIIGMTLVTLMSYLLVGVIWPH